MIKNSLCSYPYVVKDVFIKRFLVDVHFASNAARVRNREVLNAHLSEAVGRSSRNALLKVLEDKGVPAGPILTVEEALNDAQLVYRNMIIQLASASGGASIPGVRSPIRFSSLSSTSDSPAPRHGSGPVSWRKRDRGS